MNEMRDATGVGVDLCANCGATKGGPFCSVCGQNDRFYAQSTWRIVGTVFRETFEVDGRIFRTLFTLIRHPGQLSLEFANDRRASFIAPVRLYLATSLVYFVTLSFNLDAWRTFSGQAHFDAPPPSTRFQEKLEEVDLDALGSRLGPVRVQKVREILLRADENVTKRILVNLLGALDSTQVDAFGTVGLRIAVDVLDSPARAFERLIDNLPLLMFFLLPFYTAILKLCYIPSARYLAHHFVFAIHLHCFTFLLFSLLLSIPDVSAYDNWMADVSSFVHLAFTVLGFVYVYKAFRLFYNQGVALTLCKVLVTGALYWLAVWPALFVILIYSNWPT